MMIDDCERDKCVVRRMLQKNLSTELFEVFQQYPFDFLDQHDLLSRHAQISMTNFRFRFRDEPRRKNLFS